MMIGNCVSSFFIFFYSFIFFKFDGLRAAGTSPTQPKRIISTTYLCAFFTYRALSLHHHHHLLIRFNLFFPFHSTLLYKTHAFFKQNKKKKTHIWTHAQSAYIAYHAYQLDYFNFIVEICFSVPSSHYLCLHF